MRGDYGSGGDFVALFVLFVPVCGYHSVVIAAMLTRYVASTWRTKAQGMLLVFGIHRFGRRIVAYRNTYCRTCEGARLAEQFRTFNFFHFFWVPLIPLGFRRYWVCTECGINPTQSKYGSPFIKWLALVFLILPLLGFTAALIFGGKDLPVEFRLSYLIACPILLGLVVACIGWMKKGRQEGEVQEVEPLTGETCRYCDGKLFKEPDWHCRDCRVWRY